MKKRRAPFPLKARLSLVDGFDRHGVSNDGFGDDQLQMNVFKLRREETSRAFIFNERAISSRYRRRTLLVNLLLKGAHLQNLISMEHYPLTERFRLAYHPLSQGAGWRFRLHCTACTMPFTNWHRRLSSGAPPIVDDFDSISI